MQNFRFLAPILTDIFNFVTHSLSHGHTQDVELCTWPEARSTANKVLLILKIYIIDVFHEIMAIINISERVIS